MATRNISQIPAPRVPLVDVQTNTVSREWFVWFNNIYAITGTGTGITAVINGGTGLGVLPTNGQLLIGNGTGYTLNTLGYGAGISVVNASGSITVANTGVLSFSGSATGLTPATATTGNVVLSGTLNPGYGGTGQTSYTNGQLLIGNTTGNTLGKATLTAGSGIAITNGAASIAIASDKAYGSFYDTTTQSAAALTIAAITFNSTSLSYNVAIGSPTSRIVVTRAGFYNIQFSAQISNPSAAIDDVTIWIRQNGVDIADSAGIVGTPAKHGAINGHTIIGWNYILQAAASDYFELYWITDNGTTQILTYPASATAPIHPQAPSMILTVQQV
ncbi:MAG: hypothetical protein JZU60_03725 [Ilumatobacteraceae bacterium]|nr:hypothetical protein [Ilumatobacteraceae bacterium]